MWISVGRPLLIPSISSEISQLATAASIDLDRMADPDATAPNRPANLSPTVLDVRCQRSISNTFGCLLRFRFRLSQSCKRSWDSQETAQPLLVIQDRKSVV